MNKKNLSTNLSMAAYALLFTALIAIGGHISITVPFSPVPIVLANLFTLLAGLLLGKLWGCLSVVLYLFLGAIGLPVFAEGKGGFVHLIGPTGGYLFGYLVSTFLVAFISEQGKTSWGKDLIALIVGVLTFFVLGVPWLKLSLSIDWKKAIELGMLPFLSGGTVKIAIALVLAQILRPIVGNLSQMK